jgi:hypothetical protein
MTCPMGWEALAQWGDDVARIERLAGGAANEVWSVRANGQLAVARLGARSDADLAWETDLLRYLHRPETEADWRRVADALRTLHRLTQGWPQRPGWRSSTDLSSGVVPVRTTTQVVENSTPSRLTSPTVGM